jgi:hypothetical protein
MDTPEHAPLRQHETGRDGPDLFEDLMSKQRREQPQDSIFADNPFLDGLFEWMDSPEGQKSIEVRDVLWNLLEYAQLDAEQRKLIWPDAERLDLQQSIQRVQKKYPDFPRDEVEEFLLDWIDMGYDPENYSQAQLDELDSLTERWVADHLRMTKASKKRKRTRHSWASNPARQQNLRGDFERLLRRDIPEPPRYQAA